MSETSSIENEDSSWGELDLICGWTNDECTTTIMERIEAFLEDYSRRPIDQRTGCRLVFWRVVITRRMIAFLRPLLSDEASLSLHDNVDSMEPSSGSTANNTPTVFSDVDISECRFFSQDDATTPDQEDDDDDDTTSPDSDGGVCTPDHEDVCSLDDKRCFLSAISRCSDRVKIFYSPEILSDLLNIAEIEHLEAETLKISQSLAFTESECIRLCSIIQRSVKLKQLDLRLPDVPQVFCDSLANAIHLQSLHLGNPYGTHSNTQVDIFFAKMISNEDANGALESLLRNPKNQLKSLWLSHTCLQDHHVMVLAHLLPTSHLETFSLCGNNIQPPGFLEVARQLPEMHSLNFLILGNNPWEQSSIEAREECGAALLHGLIENPSIEYVGKDCLNYFPQCELLWHYLCLNSAGRRILTSSQGQPIPDGLWPHILSRAGGGNPEFDDEGGLTCIPIYDENKKIKYNGEANAVYFFLQNCPKLLSWR